MSRGWVIALSAITLFAAAWVVAGILVRRGFYTTDQIRSRFQNPNLHGQTVIVTGSNSGIGEQAARALSELGATVVFACRSKKRGFRVAAAHGGVFHRLDLADPDSVRTFHAEFVAAARAGKYPPLKTIVCNAGIFPLGGKREYVQWGQRRIEKTFAVNHLGHFYLVQLFLDMLKKNKARVVVVSSGSYAGPVVVQDMRREQVILDRIVSPPAAAGFSALSTYGTSKRCNVLFARELYARHGVASCSIHPGALITTGIARRNALLYFLHRHVVGNFTKSADQGAAMTVYACLLPAQDLVGQYMDKPFHGNTASTRAAARVNGASALWRVSDKCVRGTF